jgi:hypothetical protein
MNKFLVVENHYKFSGVEIRPARIVGLHCVLIVLLCVGVVYGDCVSDLLWMRCCGCVVVDALRRYHY